MPLLYINPNNFLTEQRKNFFKIYSKPSRIQVPTFFPNLFKSTPPKERCTHTQFPRTQLTYLPRPLFKRILSVQFSSVTQSCPTLCNPMNSSTPDLPVHHQLPEFTQIHVHRVGDAIQTSHPLSSPSPPAPNPSQHQGLFQGVNSSHQVAKVLEFQLQHQSFQ